MDYFYDVLAADIIKKVMDDLDEVIERKIEGKISEAFIRN